MMRFERFDVSSQDVMARAYEIQQRHDSREIDSPHLFLALLEQNSSQTTQVLAHLKVDATQLRLSVGEIVEKHSQGRLGKNGEVFITPHAKRVVDLAYDTAMRAQAPLIDASYILRAIAAERDTPLAQLLAEHSITPASVDEALRSE
jgi:ATP-dependent Clp protease ATP-binding subunit ClpC